MAIPAAQAASYPPRPGNSLRLLIDGEPAFRRIYEAIEAARHSVWVTVTFMWASFRMPDDRGSALDVLNCAAKRGLDVRLVFWRPDFETENLKANAFWGSPEHFKQLETSGSHLCARWDRAEPGYCQHQKSWLIDGGTDAEIAFVGGINLNPHSMVAPGHRGAGQNHDVYLEMAGPSVVDVHHNFVQRWNEASERHLADGRWGNGSDVNLPFPERLPALRGDAIVQVQRTIHSGRYRDGRTPPSGLPFAIAGGERSNLEQYLSAIAAARHWIYFEHQHVDVAEIIDCLRQALVRGVEIVAVMPLDGKIPEELAALGSFENFTLAGISGPGAGGSRNPVWVHAKLMIVDGDWATVGSCNLHRHSLFGNAEMNVAFWDRQTARALFCGLLQEHLDRDISEMDELAALRMFRTIAIANRTLSEAGDDGWQGLAVTLLP